jgi:DNA-directed RNA polymerase subunit omega
MLVEPNLDLLLSNEALDNKFALVTLALKRARQLNDGSPVLTETNARKSVSQALWEIAAGKISVTRAANEDDDFLPHLVDGNAGLSKSLGADPDSGSEEEELEADVN